MHKPIQAVIYGDSIMNGTVLNADDRYTVTMGETLTVFKDRFNIDTINRSHYGITVVQGERMLKHDLKKGLPYDYALVEFGGNDCNFKWEEISRQPEETHSPRTLRERFEETVQSMVEELKKANIRPILMTLPPIDAERYLKFLGERGNDCANILKWLGDVQMIYRFHESYSRTVEAIARRTNSLLVDVRSHFLDKHNFKELICRDGIHPTAEGYKLLAQAFSDFIAERLPLRLEAEPAV